MATLQTIPDGTSVAPYGAGGASASSRMAARSFLYAVFKHRWLVLGVFGVVFVTTTVAAITRPRAWVASSKVLVKLGETVQLAPAEAPSRSMRQPLSQDIVRTEVDIVRSWEVVRRAVEELGITPANGGSRADLVEGIRQGLQVAPTPGTNMLRISLVGKDPERVASLVNTITASYVSRHNDVYRREGIHSFYSNELRGLEDQLSAARERLRLFVEEAGVTDVDHEIQVMSEQTVLREKALKAHRAKMEGIDRKLAALTEQLAVTPEVVEFSREYQQNPTIQLYESQLAKLEIERADALQRYLPSDRHVMDLDRQIALLEARAGDEQRSVVGKQSERRNQLHMDLQRDLFRGMSQQADLVAREPSRVRALEEARGKLADLRDKRFVVEELEQEVAQKQYAYDLYWKKREEARISEAMTEQSMVEVSIVERAVPPRVPQNGIVLPILLGFVGGLTLATAMAIGVEFLNGRLRFEEEVEHYLELPVLAVIPDFQDGPDLAKA